ncbi:ABC transporter permease [Aurantimonas sp. C2-6-R+9]|uniref:ABC transporter permease n=1 Tax=unclassified Aurantimonas TaxID=2638230 RepID=UPI002E19438F|nr:MULTISPECIES: ABC transporter permease [unclassified Aurantimonas]MEC5291673.1 ABC transporter permease [Aurantimonas sp. C2-3-R2]MEC5381855.1 ABC transporter permease [Aurantimonas sp. C2-6-R+9]MEC5412757.1 ABC transporter permease [Aurantimonas sp. C2-4-R8]
MDIDWTLIGFGPTGWGDDIARGVLVTAALALATLPIGLVAGFLLALAKQSQDRFLKLSADIYTTIFRGLPELLTLFLVYFGVNGALKSLTDATGLPSLALSSFVSGMVALGFVFAAFASEVFLSAFRAIPQGQREGAAALGLRRSQTMVLVILPQLIRIALPGLGNLWMNLLKDTALVSVIGLADILRQSQIAARVTREPFLFFGVAIVLYLVLTILSSAAIGRIDRWTKRGELAK